MELWPRVAAMKGLGSVNYAVSDDSSDTTIRVSKIRPIFLLFDIARPRLLPDATRVPHSVQQRCLVMKSRSRATLLG